MPKYKVLVKCKEIQIQKRTVKWIFETLQGKMEIICILYIYIETNSIAFIRDYRLLSKYKIAQFSYVKKNKLHIFIISI